VNQLYGLIPEYQEWFKARCTPKTLMIDPWKTEAKEKCEFDLLEQEQEQASDNFWRKAMLKKYGK
jgi:hypothetical protein